MTVSELDIEQATYAGVIVRLVAVHMGISVEDVFDSRDTWPRAARHIAMWLMTRELSPTTRTLSPVETSLVFNCSTRSVQLALSRVRDDAALLDVANSLPPHIVGFLNDT